MYRSTWLASQLWNCSWLSCVYSAFSVQLQLSPFCHIAVPRKVPPALEVAQIKHPCLGVEDVANSLNVMCTLSLTRLVIRVLCWESGIHQNIMAMVTTLRCAVLLASFCVRAMMLICLLNIASPRTMPSKAVCTTFLQSSLFAPGLICRQNLY